MSVSALGIEVSRAEGRVEVWASGELDVSTVTMLRGVAYDEIANAPASGPLTLVLDLREVSFVDSTGLGMLIAVRRRANESQVKMVVSFLQSGRVENLLRMTGLLQVFGSS